MGFGLSFGKKKQSTNQTQTQDLTTTQNQAGTTNQAQTESSTSTTSGTTATTTTGGSRSQTAGTSATTTAGTERQVGTTTQFSGAILEALEAAGLGSLARVAGQAPVDVSGLDFDSDQFVNDAVTRAAAAAGQARDSAEGGLFDAIGGTSGGNTMAALLAQQLANQEAASVAGARNDAVTTAAGIEKSGIEAELAARGQSTGVMDSILQLLRGGVQTTDVASQSEQQQRAAQESIGSEQQSQQSTQQTQQQTQQISQLVSLISQLVSGTTRETGTTNVKGTTKESGGGFSLAL